MLVNTAFVRLQGMLVASSAVLVLALVTAPAHAEKVEHTFTGTVTAVSDGVGGTIDLTATFSPGNNVTIVIMVERSTAPIVVDDQQAYYLNPISLSSYIIGSYSQASAAPVGSISYVGNDVAAALQSPGVPLHRTLGAGTDYFLVQLQNPSSPPIGGAVPLILLLDMYDEDGDSFSDASLPRTFPNLSNFEVKEWTLQFLNGSQPGFVSGTIGGVVTPANASTWGRLKASYRD